MELYAKNGWRLEIPNVDRSTGAMRGQHSRIGDKSKRLKKFYESITTRNEVAEIIKRFTVRDSDGSVETFTVVRGEGNDDVDNNVITDVSPLGKALLSAKDGIARVFTPHGLKILQIL